MHRKLVEWILRRKYRSKSKGDDSHFDSSFATSLKRADSLAIAMEARGYQGGKGRSQYRQLKWTLKDTLTILVILVLGCCLFFLKS